MRHVRAFAPFVLAALALAVLAPAPAYADATLFLGASTSPANRSTKGVAIGAGLLVIGFEFEYADTTDDVATGAPALKTGMGNVLLQSPISFVGIQPYVTVGGGVKIALVGPIRLRVDYRVFTLKNGALTTPAHRIYAGLNLKF